MNEEKKIPRIVSTSELLETGLLTRSAIRRGLAEGWIPHFKIGKKNMINLDKLIEFMENC
jgi:hypothetical protein